jgi:hypothetical protein
MIDTDKLLGKMNDIAVSLYAVHEPEQGEVLYQAIEKIRSLEKELLRAVLEIRTLQPSKGKL